MWYGFFQTTCTGGGAKGESRSEHPRFAELLYSISELDLLDIFILQTPVSRHGRPEPREAIAKSPCKSHRVNL